MFFRIFQFAKCFIQCNGQCAVEIKNYNLRTAKETITNVYFFIFQHVRNSLDGEARVLTPAQSYNVDGFHADSNTVYEYQGCIFHGCKRCFSLQRQKKRHCHPDRTVEEVYQATCLSLWGKFGERQNKPMTHCITQPAHLFRILDDKTFEISAMRICSQDVMEIVTATAEEEYERSFKTNVFVAAFTTSLARLKLYEALDFLGDRALYYDTDSVIYKTKPGQEKLPLGPYLGQFTDELGGDFIVEFCSGGAKNYGYLTKKGKVECKVRGFTLNYETLQILNYYTMRDNILRELDQPLQQRREMAITIPDFFARDQTTKKIKLTEQVKKYGLVFDKRVIDPATCVSTPYGYNWFGGEVELLLSL